jgi:arylsulfatase A-like enzyme
LFEEGNQGSVRRNVQPLMFHYPWFDSVPMSAIRSGDYKLVKDLNTAQTRLFNVARDLGETKDLSARKPGLVERLHGQLNAYLREVNAEDLEDLRRNREQTLQAWIDRDRTELETLRARAAVAPPSEREAADEKLEELERRLNGHKAALERVERGRHLTAW